MREELSGGGGRRDDASLRRTMPPLRRVVRTDGRLSAVRIRAGRIPRIRSRAPRNSAWIVTPALVAGVLASCSRQGGPDGRSYSDSVPRGAIAAGGSGAPADTVAANPTTWDAAAVGEALGAHGIKTLGSPSSVSQPFLSVPGLSFELLGGQLQAFMYADAGAVARDASTLDTARVQPPTMMISWRAKPTLITANNLLLILVSNDAELRDRVRGAFRR